MAKKLNPWTDFEPTLKSKTPVKAKYRRVGDRVEIVGTMTVRRKKAAKRK